MTGHNTDGIRSALGEHLVTLLIIAIVILGAATTFPMLEAQTAGTAAQAEERVNLPFVVASSLDAETASSSSP